MALSVATLAILLHRYRLVHIQGLEYAELSRALLASVFAFGATIACVRLFDLPRGHQGDLIAIATGTIVWALVCAGVLLATGSELPRQLLRR